MADPLQTADVTPTPPSGLTAWLISLGLTRDWFGWFWSRLTAGALIIITGVVPLDQYVSPRWQHVVTMVAGIVLFFSGHFDKSPLPSAAGLQAAQAAAKVKP